MGDIWTDGVPIDELRPQDIWTPEQMERMQKAWKARSYSRDYRLRVMLLERMANALRGCQDEGLIFLLMEGISIYTLSPDLARVVEGVLVGHSDASIQADGTICFSPLHNVQAQHLEHHTGIRAKVTALFKQE